MKIAFLMLLAVLAVAHPAWATTYLVRPAGNDQADGKTPATALKTLSRAAELLNHGDSIVLAPGTYRGSVLIAERFGTEAVRILITGDESGQQTGEPAGPVVLDSGLSDQPALHLSRLKHVTLSNLTFKSPMPGLKIESSRDVIVQRCTFDSSSRGLIIEGSHGTRVESSVFYRCLIGLFVKNSVDTRLTHLTVGGSTAAGAILLSSGAGEIRNCLFTENNTAYVADLTSGPQWSSDYNAIRGDVGPWGEAPSVHNVYEWFAASGQERHSVHVTPAFVDPESGNLHVAPEVGWAGGLPGANVQAKLATPVQADRDGKPLASGVGAYVYPEPVAAGAWKKLNAKMEGEGPRQSAALYTADGSLVRTLLADAAGVTDLWWDGLDDQGKPAPTGQFVVKSIVHDVKMLDDGNFADNGNPAGAYNCDNPERLVVCPDGSFFVATPYDEAGYPLRKFSSTGQSTMASNLADKEILAMGRFGEDLVAVIGKTAPKLARINAKGERVPFANGQLDLAIFAAGEAAAAPLGIALRGNLVLVALPGLDVIRSIDLGTGNKVSDWSVASVSDLALDETGGLWAISGQDVVNVSLEGAVARKFSSGLPAPRYLAVQNARIAVVDRTAAKLTYLDAGSGQVIKTIGRDRPLGEWLPISAELLRDPRGVAFLPDGRLLLAEAARLRSFWPETLAIGHDILSNFMDTTIVNPVHKQYLYNSAGIFEVDPSTGSWSWKLEQPMIELEGREAKTVGPLGAPSMAVMLGGKPFVVYHVPDKYVSFFDVSDPVKPRLATTAPKGAIGPWSYSTITFTKDGHLLIGPGGNALAFTQYRYTGLDPAGNPQFDWANPVNIGSAEDPQATRGMKHVGAISADSGNGDIYFLAVTSQQNKMVPGWGADGTGVGKTLADGTPKWFALSSGGNYMSISTVSNGQQTLTLAGKSFGGQIDVFDADGLRLTTGNWSWPTHYQIGFVDLRYGVHAYVRPDGKFGAYVEDDAIGRFARARIDNIETIKKSQTQIDWNNAGVVEATGVVFSDKVMGKSLTRATAIPKVAPLGIDGNFKAWSDAGVTPQVVILPASIGFGRVVPPNLLADFREGTAIAALAHDGQNLYVYFVATDTNPIFDADKSGMTWMYDGLELWLEEEQFGLAFTKDGTPVMHKFRHHDKAGKEWSANYALPRENIWAMKIANLDDNPLGRQLAGITGASFVGKPGWAVCGKIPLEEIKLVGGAPGREPAQITPMTGQPGELLRIGIALGAVSAPGREQDFKVNWPAGLMFSDPTRSGNFVMGK